MSIDDWQLVFISVILVLVIVINIPLVMKYIPNSNESFMSLAILGEKVMAENYYPENNPNIELNNNVDWNLYLYNHMDKSKYILVNVKITNSSILSPNSTTCAPSPASSVYQIRRILLDNETLITPFSWRINNISNTGKSVKINTFSLNRDTINTDVMAINGYNFRIIFELWVYNKEVKEFQFGWKYGEETNCAWTQIWFNSTSPN
jgi:uncharacterized membrane protein